MNILGKHRDKVLIVAGLIGWGVLMSLEALAEVPPPVKESARFLLTTLLAVGLLYWMLKETFEAAVHALKEGFIQLGPELEKGFHDVAQGLNESRPSAANTNLADFLPLTVRFIETALDVQLEPAGNALFQRIFTIRNISSSGLSHVQLPMYSFDCPDPTAPEGLDSFVSLHVDGRPIRRNVESLRSIRRVAGSIYPERPYKEMVETNWRVPVNLAPGDCVRVDLRHRLYKVFSHMEELEIFGARIAAVTEKLTLTLSAPTGGTIVLVQSQDYPDGIQVLDAFSKLALEPEMKRMTEPSLEEAKRLYWQVLRPKIGLLYAMRFRAMGVPQ